MSSSLYLSRLSNLDRHSLEEQLWSQQNRKCFISEEPIDLTLDETDIDHIIRLEITARTIPPILRSRSRITTGPSKPLTFGLRACLLVSTKSSLGWTSMTGA